MTKLEAQWTPVKHVILGDDPKLRVYAEVSVWFKKLELVRQNEHERLFLQDPTPEDLEVHKSLLQRLIADGDHLLRVIQQVGLPIEFNGIKPEDLKAAVETLGDTYRGWHEPMQPEQRARVLREIFPDVA